MNTEENTQQHPHTALLHQRGLLVVLSTNYFSQSYILDNFITKVGRSKKCQVAIDDLKISTEHCKIEIDENGNFFIEDLNSKNHTFVNDKQIKKKVRLFYGDKIIVGDTVMRFFFGEIIEKGNK